MMQIILLTDNSHSRPKTTILLLCPYKSICTAIKIQLQEFTRKEDHLNFNLIQMEYHIKAGNASDVILEFSKEQESDMIIIGNHRKCVHPNFFMGITCSFEEPPSSRITLRLIPDNRYF